MIEETVFYDIKFPYVFLLLLVSREVTSDFVEAMVYDADMEYFDRFHQPLHEAVLVLERWCNKCCKGEWAVLNFPVENWGKDIIFTFKEKSDAAMFKLTWVKWNV